MAKLDLALNSLYQKPEIPATLREAVLYSVNAAGKRIRPLLFLEMLTAFGLELTTAHYQVAAAVELIHTGSLIHDDLPAMDNDDYRRGKLTSHKQFDEARAILAGDSLFLDPYLLLANVDLPAETVVRLVGELSYASGSFGMVAGQILDMQGEGKELELVEIEQIHRLKTGRMLTFPFVAAGIIAGKSEGEIQQLRDIGQRLGLAFQIRDDILDVTETLETLGKTPGKDALEKKSTYVSLLGLDGARKQLSSVLTEVKTGLGNLYSGNLANLIESLAVK